MTEARTLWLTGLSGAGKSTIAVALKERFEAAGRMSAVLDGDAVRTGLCADLGFSPEARSENIRRVAHVCKLFNDAGLTVIVAMISPYMDDRRNAQIVIGASRFVEVHIATTLEVCERRDPKGLYSKARAGLIPQFTGITAPYEAPATPSCQLDTAVTSVSECVAILYALAGTSEPTSS
ncbi:MAG: cysC [Rhodocyclales bacterium]|nr:cysC [Rhodocyclales bacterium]